MVRSVIGCVFYARYTYIYKLDINCIRLYCMYMVIYARVVLVGFKEVLYCSIEQKFDGKIFLINSTNGQLL